MPSRISVELSPTSATDSVASLPSPASLKKQVSTPSAVMENATASLPQASPTSSASASFPSSSTDSSPSSSTLSLPPSTLPLDGDNEQENVDVKGKGKGKGKAVNTKAETSNADSDRDRALFCPGPGANQDVEALVDSQESQTSMPPAPKGKGKGKGIDTAVTQESDNDTGAASSKSGIYTNYNTQSSSSSSSTSLSSLDDKTANRKGVALQSTGASGSGSRMASSSAQYSYMNGVGGSSSGSGSGSGSGSCSKPALNRSATAASALQSSSVPALQENVMSEQDMALLSYDAIPADFDFGDLPFYDTDPRTGVIYGDPRAITLPYLVPEKYFDLYRMAHDDEDPRKTNIYNKYGGLIYNHPGRPVGQDQDALRSTSSNQTVWTMSGRGSTWGVLTATQSSSKRQIRIVMESNKKKAATESSEPQARFTFRWKDDDFVTEYRKQKDQYRITTSQMCGGESKWKPPQPKISQTMFHGIGMEAPGNPYGACTIGTPSAFDPTRYLQLVSDYRLNSGPVRKDGDFELHNPDTCPPELRTFLMIISIVVLEMMRPFDDKAYLKEFPAAALMRSKTSTADTLHLMGAAPMMMNGRPMPIGILAVEGTGSLASLAADKMTSKIASEKAPAKDTAPSAPALRSRSKTVATSSPSSVPTDVPATKKKSRWGGLFSKK
ncbi:hypothetical protein B0O80DRAFT_524358 [Mortierella sp. GBAus27b]|nr:hypothetical protein BGX31_007342 [Mortierella sp. GBA43]KAI8361943.1 hypothetical protein B0O80DRAFT_524358 [Mortierella sp. GBAus27b]